MLDVEPYLDKWCDALDAQVSQFYDWLPWDKGTESEVAALGDRTDIAKRNAYIKPGFPSFVSLKERAAVRVTALCFMVLKRSHPDGHPEATPRPS